MTWNLETALEAARGADYWLLDARFGSNIGLVDEGHLSITARMFNTLVHFLPPTDELPTWRLATEDITDDDVDKIEVLGDVSVAHVIDTVPSVLEEWVLAVTHEAADYLSESDDDQLRRAGMRLRSEHEQGDAHSARWQTRADARYGDVQLDDFPDDAELSYERTEVHGDAALLVYDVDDSGDRRVLVAPSAWHPWRWSTPDHVDHYGERLSVREAMQRASEAHDGWVCEQTAFALGETLAALRGLHEQALSGTDPESLRELGRLAGHAQALAEGLQAPLL
jgi:hypothetical protein